jgi:hypothetical protein
MTHLRDALKITLSNSARIIISHATHWLSRCPVESTALESGIPSSGVLGVPTAGNGRGRGSPFILAWASEPESSYSKVVSLRIGISGRGLLSVRAGSL